MTAIPTMVVLVALDDGREYKVAIDQRDMARVAMTTALDMENPQHKLPLLRAWSWAALTRTGQLEGMGRGDFEDACTWVVDTDEGPGQVDPTPVDGPDS